MLLVPRIYLGNNTKGNESRELSCIQDKQEIAMEIGSSRVVKLLSPVEYNAEVCIINHKLLPQSSLDNLSGS